MIEITRTTERWTTTPLTWVLTKLAGGADSAWVVCGNGHRASLIDHHVNPDGTVIPSLDCVECPWHESGVVLVGWADRNNGNTVVE